MRKYTQKIQFERHFEIEANSAEEANGKLLDMIHESEFHGDVQNCGYFEFEDDPVCCPKCDGVGLIYSDKEDDEGMICATCRGEGTIPFKP